MALRLLSSCFAVRGSHLSLLFASSWAVGSLWPVAGYGESYKIIELFRQ